MFGRVVPLLETAGATRKRQKNPGFEHINDKLADKDGRLFDDVMNPGDKLHRTIKGCRVWVDALKPIFTELLGPQAETDLAPPPTGDPSAQRRF